MNNSVHPYDPHTANRATVRTPADETTISTLFEELRLRGKSRSGLVATSMGSALEGIWSNRTRSFLTMLGIVIGIAAVIGALTLTQGVGVYITNIITSQGASTITVYGQAEQSSKDGSGSALPSLTPRDLLMLKNLPHVQGISPYLETIAQTTYGHQNWQTFIQGVSTDFQSIQNWQVAQGRWFGPNEDAGGEPVAVIGDTVANNLFGASDTDAIGKKIYIGSQVYRVDGILAPRGGREDDVIFIPYKKIQSLFSPKLRNFFSQIYVQADAASDVNSVVQEITTTLELNHRIQLGKLDNFYTQTSAQLLQQEDQSIQAIALLLTSIAAISLTVGGIGIMNIMLVSVTERTREIGIRMSVGARRRDIRNQFLIEALILCLLGGGIGLLLGIFAGWLMVGVILSLLAGSSGGSVPLVITPTTLVLPFAVALAVGLLFGLYPAILASRLDPIVALRRAK
jgi:putative ABC transport system permease protein